jgi:hypothetical protein
MLWNIFYDSFPYLRMSRSININIGYANDVAFVVTAHNTELPEEVANVSL